MSKFKVERSKTQPYWLLYKGNSIIDAMEDDELSDLASCVGAALAEANSKAMACHPECNIKDEPICGSQFTPLDGSWDCCANRIADGSRCIHLRGCHQNLAQPTHKEEGE